MLTKILIFFAAVLIVFLGIVAMQPSDFRITRTATIAAPPSEAFAQVNDLRQWKSWSPWAKRDPSAKETYEGPASGTGASFTWAGNKEVGEGRMTITESRSNEVIRLKLEFFKPFAAVNTAEFSFKPEGNQTTVSWSMFGKNTFMGRVVCVFMNMDKMIGTDFENGLTAMKSIIENTAKRQQTGV